MDKRTITTKLLASAAAFRSDRRGQVAVTFALTLIPAISLMGAAIDYSSLVKAKTDLQNRVDAVALGAQQQNITTNSALLSYAQRFVPATGATYNATDGSMCVTAQQSIQTNVLKLVKINTMSTSATACSLNQITTTNTYEIAIALDNTGSMAVPDVITGKTKMASEITAAKNFVNQLFASAASSQIQISLVPFTTAVNVGTGYSNAAWMDTNGKSSIHWENFPKLSTASAPIAAEDAWNPKSRFDLFTQINQSWAGCAEERPQPYTLTDDKADPTKPDTLYVPLFAPDESDNPNVGYRSYNSYLNDAGGYCVSGDAYDQKDANGTFKDGSTFFNDNQQKLCKYAVKWAANNQSPTTIASAAQNAIATWLTDNGSPGTNNWTINGYAWNNYQVPAATIAGLMVANNLYSMSSGNTSVNFCTNFSVTYNYYSGKYALSSNNNYCYTSRGALSTNYSASMPANYVNNPQGSSWTSSSSNVQSTGWGASSSYSAWNGSGWGYGGSGWGTGAGWGWGGGSGNSTGFGPSVTNPGLSATGASSTQYIGSSQFNIGGGANSGCDATLQPLTTLTNNQGTLISNLGKMTANGATNLVSGFMWAWRTISPNGPFNVAGTSPVRDYATANNKKIIVFMTDGFNNWEPDDSQNGGVYSAFGYYKNNRLGAMPVNGASANPTASNNRKYLDAAFLQACTNAKNAGIEVYTVAFSITNALIDQQGQDTVKACATDASHYFKATNGNELNTFFQNIGNSVMQNYLRLKS